MDTTVGTNPEISDAGALVLAIGTGDRKAEQNLVERYWRGLYFVLVKRLRDKDLAADLTQDSFLIVLQHAREQRIDNPEAIASYIRHVGVNVLIEHKRKDKRRNTFADSELLERVADERQSLFEKVNQEIVMKLTIQIGLSCLLCAAAFSPATAERETYGFRGVVDKFEDSGTTPLAAVNSAQIGLDEVIFSNDFESSEAAPGGVSTGLQVWLRASTGVSASDGGDVLTWSDSSGQGNDATYNTQNIHAELPPTYASSNPGANNQASVRFSNQNALELDLTFLAASNYTIFVVNGRDSFGLANFYVAGESAFEGENLVLGYEDVGLLRHSHFARDLDAIVTPYVGSPLWVLDTFRFSSVDGKDIFQDGQQVASDDVLDPLVSNSGTTLGHFRAFGEFFWFQGDLAEVIVYDRALSLDERLQVEAELAALYGLQR